MTIVYIVANIDTFGALRAFVTLDAGTRGTVSIIHISLHQFILYLIVGNPEEEIRLSDRANALISSLGQLCNNHFLSPFRDK